MLFSKYMRPLLGGACGLSLVAAVPPSRVTPATARRAADVAACRLPAVPGADLSSGFGFGADCAPSTGTLDAFMFFVDFADQEGPAGDDDTPDALHDFLVPGAAAWYATSSYGRLALNVTADRAGFRRMPPASSYGWDRGLTYEAHETYIQDALDAYTADGGPPPPEVDVLYVVATRVASLISFSPTFMGEVVTRSGVRVASKAVTIGHDAYDAWRHLVVNHETGHAICLPDLYPVDGRPTGLYVGGWDLMGYINGPSPDYLAWNKWRLDWLDDADIDCVDGAGSSTHTLSAIEVADDELNDAALTLDGASEYAVPGWGVTVRVTAQDGDAYTIQVDVA